MSRRVIGILAAVVLAIVGTVALAAYVRSAEQRALAGEDLVEVYVVASLVDSGTPAEDLQSQVVVEQVPVKVRADGAVESLSALTGLVAAVELVPGEQLVASRFVQRSEFADRQVGIEVPEDLVEITIELEPQRAVGGLLEPGQRVMVVASFEPFQLTRTLLPVDGEEVALPAAVADGADGTIPNETDLLLRKVLVTAVQEPLNRSTEVENERLTTAPDTTVFVTLAVSPLDASRLVFSVEFGEVWLAAERETVPDTDVPSQTRGSVLLGRSGAS